MLRTISISWVLVFSFTAFGTASELLFERKTNKITLFDKSGLKVGSYEAYNNVVAGHQPYPAGIHKFSHAKAHDNDAPGSDYGSYGIVVFDVPKRTGMGVHSGRSDAKNNPGPKHPTLGCIRTTDEAMKKIVELHKTDKLTLLKVVDNQ